MEVAIDPATITIAQVETARQVIKEEVEEEALALGAHPYDINI